MLLIVVDASQGPNGDWTHDEVYDRSIDVQVGRLHKKIQPDDNQPPLIRTERGGGYVFTAGVEMVR